MSDTIKKDAHARLISKIAEARKLFLPITKDVAAYNYKYADLDQIVNATREGLLSQGLHVYHSFQSIDIGGISFLEVSCHVTDGESEIRSSVPMPLVKISSQSNPAQEMGKLITYGRRYSLSAALCLTADEDTDAQSSEQLARQAAPRTQNLKSKEHDFNTIKMPSFCPDNMASYQDQKYDHQKRIFGAIVGRKFENTDNGWAWLEMVFDKCETSEEERAHIKAQATNLKVEELYQLAASKKLSICSNEAVHIDDRKLLKSSAAAHRAEASFRKNLGIKENAGEK